jgi:hypothetical protein
MNVIRAGSPDVVPGIKEGLSGFPVRSPSQVDKVEVLIKISDAWNLCTKPRKQSVLNISVIITS